MSQVDKRSPGPAPHFNRDEILDRLVALFWEHGFSATSHAMMREATGLSGSSLYNTFGDKRSIFDQVLVRYHDRSEVLIHPLVHGAVGIDDLLEWVDVLRVRVSDPSVPAGCLMVATMGSPIGSDPDVQARTRANIRRVDQSVLKTLQRAADLGEVNESNLGTWARLITATYLGILTAAKGSPGSETAVEMLNGLHALIRSLTDLSNR